MNDKIDYIVVQAGGKGTRLQHLTANKPKALVPIDNRPMLFHLFEKFPQKKFIIIADYKADVMKKYLSAFAKVEYLVVNANGQTGTCAGIKTALEKIPQNNTFMLIWSDLILPDNFHMPETVDNYIGLSKNFICRWRYVNHKFEEIPSEEYGVAGLFIFEDKSKLVDVPMDGEFVRWLGNKQEIIWNTISLHQTKEFGVLEEYEIYHNKHIENRCRPFNKMIVQQDKIIKLPADAQGETLAVREKAWYRYVKEHNFQKTPTIFSFEPFEMERINGKNIFEYQFTTIQKQTVLKELICDLKELHNLGSGDTDYFSIQETYINKTMARLSQVRNLVPFADKEYVRVNGRNCRNIFYFIDKVIRKIESYNCRNFTVIHGDNTFSNLMLNEKMHPVLIDPRGYFGFSEILGDPVYDWAKLYYSIAGNYDQFNLKHFKLDITEDEVFLQIDSNGWEDMEPMFFELLKNDVSEHDIKLIHALIWLSLTTYAWEDYDSICGAFYNGLYYLEEIL